MLLCEQVGSERERGNGSGCCGLGPQRKHKLAILDVVHTCLSSPCAFVCLLGQIAFPCSKSTFLWTQGLILARAKKRKNNAIKSGKTLAAWTTRKRQNTYITDKVNTGVWVIVNVGLADAKERILIRECQFQSSVLQRAHWLLEGGEKGGETRGGGARGDVNKKCWDSWKHSVGQISLYKMRSKCPLNAFFSLEECAYTHSCMICEILSWWINSFKSGNLVFYILHLTQTIALSFSITYVTEVFLRLSYQRDLDIRGRNYWVLLFYEYICFT